MKKELPHVMAMMLLGIAILNVGPAIAGKGFSSSRSWSTSSKGFAVRSYPSRPAGSSSNGSKSSGTTQFKSFKPLSSSTGNYNGRSSSGSASVLDRSSVKPSPQLQTIIREKERSGPGWLGTGMLVWLLSKHDMSASDRQWVEDRIGEAKYNGEEIAPLPAELSDVTFNWSIPSVIIQGQPAVITVVATVGVAKSIVTPTCKLKGINSTYENESAVLTWTPGKEVSAVMSCQANGWNDMRLLVIKSI